MTGANNEQGSSNWNLPPVAGLFPSVVKAVEGEAEEANNAVNFHLKLDPDESITAGIIMALIGNLVTTLGLNLQRFAHTRLDPSIPYTESRLWWLGFTFMIVGEAGNFMAYGFAPATLVAPLGASSIIANSIFSTMLLSEKFRRRDVTGCFLIILGGVGLVYFSPQQEKKLDARTLMIYIFSDIFFMYTGILMLLLVFLLSINKRFSNKHVIFDLSICAIFGSWTVMATKGLSVSVRMTMLGEENAFKSWITYVLVTVLVLTASLQVRYLNRAMSNFGTSQVVPVYYVLFTLASVLGGIIMYREFVAMVAGQIVSFFSSVLLTFIGVYLLTSDRQMTQEELDLLKAQEGEADAQDEENARLDGVMLGGGLGMGLGLLFTPFCFPLFMCCAVFSGVGIGGVLASFPKSQSSSDGFEESWWNRDSRPSLSNNFDPSRNYGTTNSMI